MLGKRDSILLICDSALLHPTFGAWIYLPQALDIRTVSLPIGFITRMGKKFNLPFMGVIPHSNWKSAPSSQALAVTVA